MTLMEARNPARSGTVRMTITCLAEEWPDRTPISEPSTEYPVLDPALIPDSLRDWVIDSAERLGANSAMIWLPAMVAIGALVGNRVRLQPKAKDPSYTVPANIAGVIVAPPSAKKTPAIKTAISFLYEIEKQRVDAHVQRQPIMRAKAGALESRKVAIKKKIESPQMIGDAAKVQELTDQLAEVEQELVTAVESAPVLITTDTTTERLLEILQANPNGVLSHWDEFAGLLSNFTKNGHEMDRKFLLTALTGTEGFRTDRIGRGRTSADIVTMSIIGGVQPDIFRQYFGSTISKSGGDGFLARLQFQLWVHSQELPYEVDREPDEVAFAQARTVFQTIAERTWSMTASDSAPPFVVVPLDEAAQTHLDDYRKQLDEKAKSYEAGGHNAFSAHLGKSRDAVCRVALIVAMAEDPNRDTSAPITLEEVTKATGLMDLFIEHAAVTYAIELPSTHKRVKRLAEYLEAKKLTNYAKPHEIQQNLKELGNASEISEALRELQDLGWLRLTKVHNAGARPSTLIELHPDLVPATRDGVSQLN